MESRLRFISPQLCMLSPYARPESGVRVSAAVVAYTVINIFLNSIKRGSLWLWLKQQNHYTSSFQLHNSTTHNSELKHSTISNNEVLYRCCHCLRYFHNVCFRCANADCCTSVPTRLEFITLTDISNSATQETRLPLRSQHLLQQHRLHFCKTHSAQEK